jgi:predicted N-acetyltransferase YhbS
MNTLSLPPRTIPVPDLPSLVSERPQDAAAVGALIDAAFGPGRFVKTAERLRETNRPLLDISFVARSHGALVGCVRMWPIHIGDRPAVFLGPFAVDPGWRRRGLGAALIRKACDAAQAAGHELILLVGPQPFFCPLEFSMVPKGALVMPGPVDPARLLARALVPGALDGLAGTVVAG